MKLKSMIAFINCFKSHRTAPKTEKCAAAAQSGEKDPADKLRCGAGLYAVQDSIERRIMNDVRADSN